MNGTTRDEEEGVQDVPVVDQNISWRSMDCLEPHTQGAQTGLAASMEGLAVLEKRPVQVQADVCLQRLWESFQHLNVGRQGQQQNMDTEQPGK